MNINNIQYEIEIIRKRNKNTYIRVKDNKIVVTTNYLMPKFKIKELIENNRSSIEKMANRVEKKEEKNSNFYYLGSIYDIIIVPTINRIEIDNNRIYVSSRECLEKWLKKETERVFLERLNYIYNLFEEDIPYPKLRIRKMKTRWGVCSKKQIVTLNSELMKYTLNEIDYVIVHELSHFVYFNHSKSFWLLVSKYCKDYKNCRKNLKD